MQKQGGIALARQFKGEGESVCTVLPPPSKSTYLDFVGCYSLYSGSICDLTL